MIVIKTHEKESLFLTVKTHFQTRVYSPKENATTDGAVVFIHGGGFAIGDIYLYDSLTKRMAAM